MLAESTQCCCLCSELPSHHYFFLQEVVPDELMEIYLSMNETARAQTVDTDLPFYCAFSLPGVALTIGKEHWPLLRPTFQTLSGDTQVSRDSFLWVRVVMLVSVLPCDVHYHFDS